MGGKDPLEKEREATLVFLPSKFHGRLQSMGVIKSQTRLRTHKKAKMHLGDIMLSERSQTQTRQYYAIYTILHNLTYTWNLRKKTVKFTETNLQLPKGKGVEEGKTSFLGLTDICKIDTQIYVK